MVFPFYVRNWRHHFNRYRNDPIYTMKFLKQTPDTHKREDRGFTLYPVFTPCHLSFLKYLHASTVLNIYTEDLTNDPSFELFGEDHLRILIRQDLLKFILSNSITYFMSRDGCNPAGEVPYTFLYYRRVSTASVWMPVLTCKEKSKPLKYRQGPLFSTTSRTQPGPRTVLNLRLFHC